MVSSRFSGWTVTRRPQRAPSPRGAATCSGRSTASTSTSVAPKPATCASQYSRRLSPRMGTLAKGMASERTETLPRSSGQIKMAFIISRGSVSGDDGAHGPGKDFNIHPEARGFDITHVEFDLAGEINVAAATDLPEAGEAGLDGEATTVGKGIESDFAGDGGTRADQGHLAIEDVDELGQLIERVATEEFANFRDTGIVFHFEGDTFGMLILGEEFLEFGFGVEAHGAEFK